MVYGSDFQWNNYNFILVKENGVINSISKKSFLGCKIEKWKSGIDPYDLNVWKEFEERLAIFFLWRGHLRF